MNVVLRRPNIFFSEPWPFQAESRGGAISFASVSSHGAGMAWGNVGSLGMGSSPSGTLDARWGMSLACAIVAGVVFRGTPSNRLFDGLWGS